MRALTSLEGPGPWSDTGEGTANTPPNLTTTAIADASTKWFRLRGPGPSLIHNLSTGGYFQDADGDTLSYSASSEYAGVIKAWIMNDVNLAIQAMNPAAATVTYGAARRVRRVCVPDGGDHGHGQHNRQHR